MSSKILTDLPMSDVTSAVASTKSHFDTFETKFFEQGDLDSARLAGEVERFEDLDGGKSRRFGRSRQLVMSVAIASACVALVAGVVLWRSGGHHASSSKASAETVVAAEAKPAPIAAPAPAANVVAAAAAQPAPTPTVPAGEPVAAAHAIPAASPIAAADDKATGEKPALAAAPAEGAPSPTEKAPLPGVAAPAPTAVAVVAEEKPAKVAPAIADAKGAATAKPTLIDDKPAEAAAQASDLRERCKKAMQSKRSKDILAACPDAFAADPAAADIAVALAKIEFDRGRVAQASTWSKKAIAADPNAADAYVFLGGAEQSAGHDKAAKEAYKHYLQLAPTGRYAGDLRAIVGSL